MRNLVLSALLLASAFQTAKAQISTSGEWIYKEENGKAKIIVYTGRGGNVVIPSVLNEYPVTSLERDWSFTPTFFNPTTSTYIPVTSLSIPSSLTYLHVSDENGFTSLSSLSSITVSPENSTYSSQDGVLYNKTKTSLVYFPPAKGGEYELPLSVTALPWNAFLNCGNLTSIIIHDGVAQYISKDMFSGCTKLTKLILPITALIRFQGMSTSISDERIAQFTRDSLVLSLSKMLASDDTFVTAVANKIKATGGNYGLSVKSELEMLATKTELTSSLAQSRTDGINSVLSNPNLWTLYTTSQIQNMAVGDLVLSRQVSGGFVLNYDIEQSTDLQNWTPYQALSLPLNGLPTDKAFVRIKAKQ
jgi:hypothetical protein